MIAMSEDRARMWHTRLLAVLASVFICACLPGETSGLTTRTPSEEARPRFLRTEFQRSRTVVLAEIESCREEQIETNGPPETKSITVFTVRVEECFKGDATGGARLSFRGAANLCAAEPAMVTATGAEIPRVGQTWLLFLQTYPLRPRDGLWLGMDFSGVFERDALRSRVPFPSGPDRAAVVGALRGLRAEHEPRALARASDVVTVGRITDIALEDPTAAPNWSLGTGRIRVDEVLKGDSTITGDELAFQLVSQKRRRLLRTLPAFEVGESALLFLAREPDGEMALLPEAGVYAKWTLRGGAAEVIWHWSRKREGAVMASRPAGGLMDEVRTAATETGSSDR